MRRLLLILLALLLVACDGTPTPVIPTSTIEAISTPDRVDVLATRIWEIDAALTGIRAVLGDASNVERIEAGLVAESSVTGITLCYD